MRRANNTTQFNEIKLHYLIKDHYKNDERKNTLINALNSFKTNFKKDNEDEQTFYVGEDTLKTDQCIAFFYVPNTQNNHKWGKQHTATYVQTSDNTPQGEIIGVYYANIDIGKEDNMEYDIQCYYLKDRCCDGEERELCGNVKMKLETEGGGLTCANHKAYLSITEEKNCDFLHDVKAKDNARDRFFLPKNIMIRSKFDYITDNTYVRMFEKDKNNEIKMKEFTKTKYMIIQDNSNNRIHVRHECLTKKPFNDYELPTPQQTTPILEGNYQNPVMRDGNNGIKTEQKEKSIIKIIQPQRITLQSKFLTEISKKNLKKNRRTTIPFNQILKKTPNKNKNNEIKIIDDGSDSKRELDSSNIIKEEQDSNDIIKKPPIEQESSNNNNLIKINNDWEVEEKPDEELKTALEEIRKLKKEIQQLKQTNKMNEGSLEAKEQHLKEAKNSNKELMNQITSKTQEMLELSDENEKFKKEKEKLKEEMTEAEIKNQDLTKKNESLNKQLKELESKLQQKYSSENQKLQKQLQDAVAQLEQYRQTIKELKDGQQEQYNTAVNSAVQKNQILEKQIEELNEKIQIYEKNGMTFVMQQNKANQQYNVKIIDLERKYTTEIKTLNTNNEQLKEENEKLKEQVKELESELEKKLKELESELQQKYSSENQKLQKELAETKQQLNDIQKQLTKPKTNLIPSNQPIAITYNGNTLEKTNLKKHTQTQFSFQSNHNINTKDNGEMVKLKEQINKLKQTNEELNNKVNEQKTEIETTNNQNKEIKQINQVLQKENEKYKESLEKANNDNKLLAQQQQDINIQLKNQIAQQQQDINDNKTLKMKMTILESNQRIHKNTIQVKDKMINNYKKNEELYNNKISKLNEKLRNQQETQKEINEKNEELQEKIKQYEEQIEKLNCAINSTQQKINTSDETNQTLERKKGELETKNKELTEELKTLNEKLLTTIEELRRKQMQIDTNEKKNADIIKLEEEKQKENNALQQDNKKLLDTIKQKEEIIIYLQNDMKRQMKIHKESIQMLLKHYEDVYQKNQTNIETIKNLQQILNKQKEVNPQTRDGDKNNKTKNDNLPKQNSVITNAYNEFITPSQLGEMLKKQNQSNNTNQIEVTSNLQYNTESKKTKPQQQTKKLKENFKPKPQDESKNKEKPQIYQLCKGGPTYEIIPNNNAYNNNNINALHPQITKNQNNNTLEQETINNNYITNFVPQIRDRTTEGIYNYYIKPYQNQMLENTNIIGSKEEQKNITPTDNLCKQNNFISQSNPKNQIHKNNNNNYKSDINKNTTTKQNHQQQKNDMHGNVLLRWFEDEQKNAGELLMKTGNMFRKKAKKDDRDDIRRGYMREVGQSSKWQQKIFLEEKQKKKMEKMYMRTGKQSSNKPIKGNHNIVSKYCQVCNN